MSSCFTIENKLLVMVESLSNSKLCKGLRQGVLYFKKIGNVKLCYFKNYTYVTVLFSLEYLSF